MPKLYVLTDYYMWGTPATDVYPPRTQHHVARRGEQIEVSDAEAKRGIEAGALSADAADLTRTEATASEPRSWGEEQIKGSNAQDLIAYVSQRPSEAERVLDIEEQRGDKVRKTVLEAIERVIEERDAELERLAALQDEEARLREEEARAAAGGAPTIPSAGQ